MAVKKAHALAPAELKRVRISDRTLPLELRLAAYAQKGSAAPLEKKCGRRLRRPPDFPKATPYRYCIAHPVPGRGCCKLHGGKSFVGHALPQFKTGRYSKLLKEGSPLWRGYHAATNDEDLLSLRNEIRMLDGFAEELVVKLTQDAPDTDELWKDCRTQVVAALAAARTDPPDAEAMLAALRRLEDVTRAGASHAAIRQAYYDNTALHAKLKETEAKILERGQHMIPVELAAQNTAQVAGSAVAAMQEEKTLHAALARFTLELQALARGAASEAIDAA